MKRAATWVSLAISASVWAGIASGCGRSDHASKRATPLSAAKRADVPREPVKALNTIGIEHLVSQLRGEKVENADGQELGKLEDLVIAMESGTPRYALVISAGLVGVGRRTIAVPARVLSGATTKTGTLALDISRARWQNAPALKRGPVLAELGRAGLDQEIARYFIRDSLLGASLASRGVGQERQSQPLPPTGRGLGRAQTEPHSGHELELSTELIGRTLRNRQHMKLGKIMDLLVDLSGQRPTFAIVLVERLLDRPELFAVALGLLHQDDDKLVLDANRKSFELAKPFDESAWVQGSTASAELYRFVQRSESGRPR